MKKDKVLIKNNWLSVYYSFTNFRFKFGPASYFDNRWNIQFSIPVIIAVLGLILGYKFGLGNYALWFIPVFFIPWAPIYLDLPIRSKWEECDPPEYGISYHDNKIWFHYGGEGNHKGGNKWYTITMPWDYTWVRTSTLISPHMSTTVYVDYCNPRTIAYHIDCFHNWIHEYPKNKLDLWDEKYKGILWKQTYPYSYKLNNGQIQERLATVGVSEREWRMRWLKWTSLFNKVRRSIDIEFNDEVGERAGEWKGGCTGCGYELKPGEYPEESLRRMEKERKFK